jgi:hypothetical protein
MKIDTNKLINDYELLKQEKEKYLDNELGKVDSLVNEKIEELKPEIEKSIVDEIVRNVDNLFEDKLTFYEQYFIQDNSNLAQEHLNDNDSVAQDLPAPSQEIKEEVKSAPIQHQRIGLKLPFMSR